MHGHCLAGATELAGHCDIVFAAEDAQFGHPAGRTLGVIPTLSMWPYLIGMRRTKEFLFTGDSMTAAQALEYGLINRVCPRDRLEEEVLAYARRVAKVPIDMLTLHKAATNRFFELMGVYAAEQSASEFDALAHQTATAKEEITQVRERGLKQTLAERDGSFAKGRSRRLGSHLLEEPFAPPPTLASRASRCRAGSTRVATARPRGPQGRRAPDQRQAPAARARRA